MLIELIGPACAAESVAAAKAQGQTLGDFVAEMVSREWTQHVLNPALLRFIELPLDKAYLDNETAVNRAIAMLDFLSERYATLMELASPKGHRMASAGAVSLESDVAYKLEQGYKAAWDHQNALQLRIFALRRLAGLPLDLIEDRRLSGALLSAQLERGTVPSNGAGEVAA